MAQPQIQSTDFSDFNNLVNRVAALERHVGSIDTDIAVTSLPGTPFEGQEIVYLGDSASGIVWRFRYRGVNADGSPNSSLYKWEFIGGGWLVSDVDTDESTSSGTYVALTTAGPSITIPLAGDWEIEIGANMYNSTAGLVNNMSYDIGGTGASDNDRIMYQAQAGGTTGSASVSRHRTKTGLAAATALVSKYRVTGAAAGNFRNRWMRVRPIRVG